MKTFWLFCIKKLKTYGNFHAHVTWRQLMPYQKNIKKKFLSYFWMLLRGHFSNDQICLKQWIKFVFFCELIKLKLILN